MSCVVGETYYKLEVPADYRPSHSFEDMTTNEWLAKLRRDQRSGLITRELRLKIVNSLYRMPDLIGSQIACVSYSGGKDSQAIFMLALMKYGARKVIGLFSDTHDEWPETYRAILDFEQWSGVSINTADSMGIHHMLRHVRNFWPQRGARSCTKELKMIPQRDWLDAHGYGQARVHGMDKFRPSYAEVRGYEDLTYEARYPAPLMLAGERWAESVNRSTLPFEEKADTILRESHRPVLDWRIEDVWDFIFYMKAPINEVYTLGVKRCACAGCIFAGVDELYLLGEHNPDMLWEWVQTERSIMDPKTGKHVPRLYSKESFADIYNRLLYEDRLGKPRQQEGEVSYATSKNTMTGQLALNF